MKAVVMTAAGGPEVLQLQDVPVPAIAAPTEMLVRLEAAGTNPIDTKIRTRGPFLRDRTPTILGCDGAGIVVEAGSGVQKFRTGDAVYFFNGGLGGPTGNYAEYTIVDEKFAVRKPERLSFQEAAAAPLVLITAWEALYDRARLQAGQKVLIHAGAGGVGHVAVQLAALQGAEVATTVGSEEKALFARSLCAILPVFYKQNDFARVALDWTGGEGVDVAFDTVGGSTFAQTFPAVKIYGDLVTLLDPKETAWKEARSRNLRISLELMLTPTLRNDADLRCDQTQILQQCVRLIDSGKLKILVRHTFPLAEANRAHALLERGSTLGKIVLVP